jgi:hypothetical protein
MAGPSRGESITVSSMASECMNRSGPRYYFAAVQHAPWDEIFLSIFQGNPLSINDQRVAALHNDHIFVVIVGMRFRWRCFVARPKCHLAPICSIEHVTLDSSGGLIGSCDPVHGMFHEFGEIVHGLIAFLNDQNDEEGRFLNSSSNALSLQGNHSN